MPYKTKEEYKEELLNSVETIFTALSNSDELNEPFTESKKDLISRVNDEKRFELYVKCKELNEKTEQQKNILSNLMYKNPELKDCVKGPFARCLRFFIDTSETKEAKQKNIELASKYCTLEGRTEMVKNAVKSLMEINPKEIFENVGNTEKMVEMYVENPLFFQYGYLAATIIKAPEIGFNAETRAFLDNNKTFFETLGSYASIAQGLGNPLSFVAEDLNTFPSQDRANELYEALNIRDSNHPLRQNASDFTMLNSALESASDARTKIENAKDIDLNKPLYQIKATKNGKEVGLIDALSDKNGKIVGRNEDELDKINPNKLEDALDYVERRCNDLKDIALVHNNKAKPGFFARIFRTKSFKEYSKEIQDINNIKSEMSEYGVSEETLNTIAFSKVATKGGIVDAIYEASENLYRSEFTPKKNDKELLDVKEADTKEKQEIKDASKEKNKEVNKDLTKEENFIK